ncbi:MAG: hypothetical protein JJ863_19435 [Deltaproteobacteria bacterium]|nr:hypothetical protein [Deltaproteobacteria bacterium]
MRAAAFALVLSAGLASAQEPPDPGELWSEARDAERRFDPAAAVAAYGRLVDAHPTHRLAARAQARRAYLEERGEGDFEPLAALLRARAEPATEAGLAAFESRVAEFPRGPVRVEARLLLADRWLELGHGDRAEDVFRMLRADPDAPANVREAARRGLARALEGQGRLDEALGALEAADENERERIATGLRVATGRWIALGVLGLFLLCFAFLTRLRFDRAIARRTLRPGRLMLGAWVLGIPWLIATRYDHEAWDTFGFLALASAPLLLASSWLGAALTEEDASRGRRRLGALAVVAGQLAIGYLVLVERGAMLGVGP